MAKSRGFDDWLTLALTLGGGIWITCKSLIAGTEYWALGLVLLLSSYGVYRNRPWARLVLLAFSIAISLGILALLYFVGFSWGKFVMLFLMPLGIREFWIDYIESKQADSADRPMTSLVLLQRKPRNLDRASIAKALHEAWAGDFDISDTDTESDDDAELHSVSGESPVFAICDDSEFYLLHDHGHKYFDDESEICDELKELRINKAVRDHEAWISIDMMHSMTMQDPESFYPHMALAIAELADADTLAIFRPDTGNINVWDEDLKKRLLDGDPVAAITELTNVPVVPVDENDPRMVAAVAEARKRWPEFLAAYEKRSPDQTFSLKGPVTRGGNTEFIWISVISIEGEFVRGELGNDPVDLGNLQIGDEVEIRAADLNDWVYPKGDDLVGLFTVKVVSEIQKG